MFQQIGSFLRDPPLIRKINFQILEFSRAYSIRGGGALLLGRRDYPCCQGRLVLWPICLELPRRERKKKKQRAEKQQTKKR